MRHYRPTFILIISIAFLNLINAQNQELPLNYDDEGNVVYDGVVNVENIEAIALYHGSKDWFVENYNSANHVIQLDDKDRMKIIGKGFFNIKETKKGRKWDLDVYHTISVQSKDGRYKYEISQIYWKWNSTTVKGCKDADWTFKSEKDWTCITNKLLSQMKSIVDMGIKEIILDLNKEMSQESQVDEDW